MTGWWSSGWVQKEQPRSNQRSSTRHHRQQVTIGGNSVHGQFLRFCYSLKRGVLTGGGSVFVMGDHKGFTSDEEALPFLLNVELYLNIRACCVWGATDSLYVYLLLQMHQPCISCRVSCVVCRAGDTHQKRRKFCTTGPGSPLSEPMYCAMPLHAGQRAGAPHDGESSLTLARKEGRQDSV